MRILIVGAGKVGSSVAGSLVSESNDVTVIDPVRSRITILQALYDLQGIVGDATSPSVLAEAGAADADMIIAVTANDETNLAVALIAEQLFNVPARIARVRNAELREYPQLLSTSGFRATSVIWPEEAITNYIMQLVTYPEALQVIEFSSAELILIAVKAAGGARMTGQMVSKIYDFLPETKVKIVSIYRQKERQKVKENTVIQSGDEIFLLTTKSSAMRVVREFRSRIRRSDRVMIVGGGNLGLQLAKALDNSETLDGHSYNIKILEADANRCLFLSQQLSSSVLVLNVGSTDETVFTNEGIANTDLFIAITGDDDTNFMSCLLAKKLGAHRAISLINRHKYIDLTEETNIDLAFSPAEATLSELLKHLRQGDVIAAHSLRRDNAEALELVAHGTMKNSKVIGRKIKDIKLPEGATIGALIRKVDETPEVFMASDDLEIADGDHVIIFVGARNQIPIVEKVFAPTVGFF